MRDQVAERQQGYCLWCEGPLGNTWALHHRKLRKHGGPDEVSNFVALHHHCHNLGTASVHLNPAKAYERGFLVHSWDNHTQTPLVTASGATVLLHEDGTQTQGEKNGW